ncbi:uncharacterized protein N7479_008815 [Penicillium vulpinum]|uniref:Enoyl reductase (ER) domain-containing protein n=1 Tax=Penicillium vulpinum TaxID=29845 RepID=A0A1V6S1R6_9EURO|nr:uncharacterized protein N7479_008815 [Penicillium vulpinum]KAJ5950402.1 hypothetical protein N7479_008815 [Penicillium vulpinum]OQE07808.1 hypothetical protein PENVUL_c012G03016 [Penicillium vulpinum]
MKALVTNRSMPWQMLNLASGSSFGQCARVADIAFPTITDGEILVQVRSIALNPIDFKNIDFLSPNKSVIGCDYAGEVVEVGKNKANSWKIGDRVAGFVHGGQYPDVGSFAEYLKVDAELAWKIPHGVTNSEATTYGIPAVTAMLALARLGIPWDDVITGSKTKSAENLQILIYSGASNVGLFTIQLAKRAGLHVVVTASPRSFDLVKRYGADSVFDYQAPAVISEISKAYPDITKAVDCFSEGNSSHFCAQVLKKGRVITLLDQGKPKKSDIEYEFLMVFTAFGLEFSLLAPLGPAFPIVPNDHNLLRQFYADLGQLCHDVVRPPPITTIKGGFDGILNGLDKLRKGEVRGTKLVIDIS